MDRAAARITFHVDGDAAGLGAVDAIGKDAVLSNTVALVSLQDSAVVAMTPRRKAVYVGDLVGAQFTVVGSISAPRSSSLIDVKLRLMPMRLPM